MFYSSQKLELPPSNAWKDVKEIVDASGNLLTYFKDKLVAISNIVENESGYFLNVEYESG